MQLVWQSIASGPPHPLYPLALSEFEDTPPMTKKRRSLQSITIPTFLQSPQFTHRQSPSRARSYSYVHAPAMDDEPPAFLLDDDPFANLTSSAVVASRAAIDRILSPTASRATSPTPVPTVAVPRSPLSPPDSVQSSYFGHVSCPRGRIKPAYERPAFSSRPSLPSLDTLAHISLAPPPKARKGKVGAGLPYEPWEPSGEEDDDGDDDDHDDDNDEGADTPCATRPASPLGTLRASPTGGDIDPTGCDRPSSFPPQDISDREAFTFYDNISTPSLELSLASLSRSLSLESVSSLEMFPGDDPDVNDFYGNFLADLPSHHDIDHPLPDLLLPSLCRLETDRSDKLHLPTISELPVELQAGSSVDTEHESMAEDGPVDSTDWSSSRGYSSNSHFGQSSGVNDFPSRRGYLPSGNGGSGGNGHGDDGDDDRRRRPTRVALSGSSTPGTSSDEEDSEEDYGQPIDRHRGGEGVIDSEDDVPLAQRIPTALEAQRSIRQKFREERDRRRRERTLKAEQTAILNPPLHSVLSSSQEAALQASRPPSGRTRTRTLPSTTPRPFAPEDLARKLQDVQVAESSQPRSRPSNPLAPRGRTRTVDDALSGPHAPHVLLPLPLPTSTSPTSEPASSRVLRTMRSFHRSDAQQSQDFQTRPSTADATTSKLGRALSRARSRARGEDSAPPSAWQASSAAAVSARVSLDNSPPVPPLPLQPHLSGLAQRSARASLENSPPVPPLPPQSHLGGLVQRKLSKVLGRASAELERSPKPPAQLVQAAALANIKTQQRIFVGDMQRFNVVEIDNNTSAADVVTMIRNQGSLTGFAGQGDWMLFEVAQDFGLGGYFFLFFWDVCQVSYSLLQNGRCVATSCFLTFSPLGTRTSWSTCLCSSGRRWLHR